MKYMNYKETKTWSASDIREMCIANDLYTCGDCESYNRMLTFVRKNKPTKKNILWVANDIFEHSNIEEKMNIYGEDESGIFENILFNIANKIMSFYEVA